MSSEENVREWMAYAERDRRAARHLLESGDYEACALHCQQAVEKLPKAGIVSQTGQRPPYWHNLWKLAQAIDGLTIPDEIADKLANLNLITSVPAILSGLTRGTMKLSRESYWRRWMRFFYGLPKY